MAALIFGKEQLTLTTACGNPLVRSVIISLFSWRRAHPDDDVDTWEKFGFWGDTYNEDPGQETGSRLWELLRAKVTEETLSRAREFCEEALQWLIDQNIASGVTVRVERSSSTDQIDILVIIQKPNEHDLNIRFQDVWSYLK